ncbi:MAG: hypothetical protein WCJ51_02935 [Candidatus Moraniibacteriota bacterium]
MALFYSAIETFQRVSKRDFMVVEKSADWTMKPSCSFLLVMKATRWP